MSPSFKTKSILSQQTVESLVSSGMGRGGEVKIAIGEWGGFRRKGLFPYMLTSLWYHSADPYVPFVILGCLLLSQKTMRLGVLPYQHLASVTRGLL